MTTKTPEQHLTTNNMRIGNICITLSILNRKIYGI